MATTDINEKEEKHEQIFTSIYERSYWGSNKNTQYKGSSGQGSAIEYNINTYIPFVKKFIIEKNIKTVIDLGCGDFRCGPSLYDDLDIIYNGYDTYKKLIDTHVQTFLPPKYNFHHLDICNKKEEIESGDLCILKDILQHWSVTSIHTTLEYFIQTKKFKYILIANCCHQPNGIDTMKTGEYRPLTCEKEPLKSLGAVKQFNWNSKEVSLITII